MWTFLFIFIFIICLLGAYWNLVEEDWFQFSIFAFCMIAAAVFAGGSLGGAHG